MGRKIRFPLQNDGERNDGRDGKMYFANFDPEGVQRGAQFHQIGFCRLESGRVRGRRAYSQKSVAGRIRRATQTGQQHAKVPDPAQHDLWGHFVQSVRVKYRAKRID